MPTVPTERQFTMEEMLNASEALAGIGSWKLDLTTMEAIWSDGLYRLHGLEPQSQPISVSAFLELIQDEDRPRIAELLRRVAEHPDEVPEEGVTAEYRAEHPDGTIRHMRFLGRVFRAADGRPVQWIGSAQDITDQLISEQELSAHYALSMALRDWESFEEGSIRLLERLATALEEPMAALWLWDEDRRVIFARAFWHDGSVDTKTIDEDLRSIVLKPGEGKPGLAWEQQTPIVTPDLLEDIDPDRVAIAERYGLRSALAVPAVGPHGTIAVLTFYSTEPRAFSDNLQRTLTSIGHDLGRFLGRRTADLKPRPLTDRETQVLRFAATGKTGREIAEQLVVSPSTVKTHFENIYEKLGVSDRAAAVAFGLRTGLIS